MVIQPMMVGQLKLLYRKAISGLFGGYVIVLSSLFIIKNVIRLQKQHLAKDRTLFLWFLFFLFFFFFLKTFIHKQQHCSMVGNNAP